MKSWLHGLSRIAARAAPQFVYLASLAASGCSFGQDTATPPERNTCVFDTDCGSKHCTAGMCVTTGPTPLSVTVEVTPKRMPDGSQPFPIVADPLALKGGTTQFDLHLPVAVPVVVHNSITNDKRTDAQVSFRPSLDSKFSAKTTQINTVGSGSATEPAYVSLLLLLGINYDVLIQPVDPKLPPHSQQFEVTDDMLLDVDYGAIQWKERKFSFHNPADVPGNRPMLRALAKSSGRPISNRVPVPANGSAATLRFDAGDTPYRLELSSSDQPQKTNVDADHCRDSMLLAPTLLIDPANLVASKQDPDSFDIVLPAPLQPVIYSGVVTGDCANQLHKSTETLPIDFKRLVPSDGTNAKLITQTFETSATANWNSDTQEYEFCAQVLSGSYVVIVTPPLGSTCERFAEKRNLTPLDEGTEINEAILALRTSAILGATVVSPEGNPVANASIDLVALGTPGVTLAENDPTVPLYNRSRTGTTGSDGKFTIPADVGNYDIIIKPPAPSNFAWWVIYNVSVASRTAKFMNTITLGVPAPVAMSGTLLYQSGTAPDQRTLASAEVHAYTVINQDDPATTRSIEIGRGQADENGSVMLLLSPELQKTWFP